MLLVIGAITMTQGKVSGTEFSPTHFQARQFEFYELPGLQLQLTPIQRKSIVLDTAIYLTQKSLVNVPPGTPGRWDLVELTRGFDRLPDDASLLTEILAIGGGQTPRWQQWSQDHPAHASVLWPIVQTLARRELYVLIPDVFQIAISHTNDASSPSAKQLRDQLADHLGRQYESLIQDLRQAGMTTAADELASQFNSEPLVSAPEISPHWQDDPATQDKSTP